MAAGLADVAKGGFEAVRAGKHKAGLGLLNKEPTGLNNLLPSGPIASIMHKLAAPADGNVSNR